MMGGKKSLGIVIAGVLLGASSSAWGFAPLNVNSAACSSGSLLATRATSSRIRLHSAQPDRDVRDAGNAAGRPRVKRKVRLSVKDLKEGVRTWADEHDFLKGGVSHIRVSRKSTVAGVMSDFWLAAADCVRRKVQGDNPQYMATYGETLLVAPVCSALNDFSTMVHVKKTSLKNSESFELLGGLLELEALHPDYVGPASGRPDEPEPGADFRAPYPVFHFLIMPGERPKDPMFMNGKEHMRMMLNNLYRSPAVSSSEDEVPAPPEAAAGFETVMEQTTAWLGELEESKSLPEGPSEPERWFTDLDEQLAEDMMVGSGRIAEHVLSEAWAVVDALSTSAASADAQEGEDRVLSKLLVLPNAHPNSAGIFYSIADHLRAALEASPILDVFTVETFHPEDVQDKGIIDPRRRSPHPTMHICHRGYRAALPEIEQISCQPLGAEGGEVPQ